MASSSLWSAKRWGFRKESPELGQQTAHTSWMVSDPKFSPNHLRHPLTRPHLSSKTVRLGSLGQQIGQLGKPFLAQAGRCPRSNPALQTFDSSAVASPLHPLAHRSLAHAQGVGYLLLGPAFLF